MIRSAFLRWGVGALVVLVVLGLLRHRTSRPAGDDDHPVAFGHG